MDVLFKAVKTPHDQQRLAELAHEIWFEYWPDLIGIAQTEYMVQRFQCLEAIVREMDEESYEYWFIMAQDDDDQTPHIVGYTGGYEEPETNRFFISKIYLLAEERGKSFASATVSFYNHLCGERGLQAMYLTVNKGNDLAIRAYKAKGFKVIDKVVTDIGEGFVMDDYIMERPVDPAK